MIAYRIANTSERNRASNYASKQSCNALVWHVINMRVSEQDTLQSWHESNRQPMHKIDRPHCTIPSLWFRNYLWFRTAHHKENSALVPLRVFWWLDRFYDQMMQLLSVEWGFREFNLMSFERGESKFPHFKAKGYICFCNGCITSYQANACQWVMLLTSLHKRSNACQCGPNATCHHNCTPMRDADKQGLSIAMEIVQIGGHLLFKGSHPLHHKQIWLGRK
jgi:hypothetical protein